MLRQIQLQGVYKSDEDNILEDFYIPTLGVAKTYDRAVGFFSASTLNYAAQALTTFIRGRGSIRLILGAFADAQDIEAVSEGHRLRDISEKIGQQFLDLLGQVSDELFQNRFAALSWLVAHGRMDIKIALRPIGMFHDKIGIITDANGDAVVFSGSANESAYALLPTHNYESIDVFPTWRPELEQYYTRHRDSFSRLWENQSRGTAVIPIPDAIRDRLLSIAGAMTAPPDPKRELELSRRIADQVSDRNSKSSAPRVPTEIDGLKFEIRQHQRDALNAWQTKGDFQGVFDLATGAGKTITAVYAIVQMAKKIPGLTVVIAAPYQNLADQWCDILARFNIQPVRCYVSRGEWEEPLENLIYNIEIGALQFGAVVVVNRTLKSSEFQAAIARIPQKQFLWIGDECHHHSSESFSGSLPENARYRIGLSATPQHYMDSERNDRLNAYYGQIVFTYSLKQAIEDKVLTPYDYFPCVVELTQSEAEEFIDLSNEVARLFAQEKEAKSSKISANLTAILMKRARVIASAANKIPALQAIVSSNKPQVHTLFYCGDGQVEAEEDEGDDGQAGGFSGRQIEVVSQVLDSLGWRLSRFTSREPRREREAILRSFRSGLIDAMVAIKCLDEGIDVPACSTAFILASSRDPRQFIQRRGRILRRSLGKEVATIYDFVVVLPRSVADEMGHARKLIRSELRRVAEFTELARNKQIAYGALRQVLVDYDLEHVI